MRSALAIILFAAFTAIAQSGRVKPSETPFPNPVRPRPERPAPTPRPRVIPPAPVKQDVEEEGIISIRSTLIPIPVSAVDANGRPVDGLSIRDFTLTIDGRQVEISDISRSETPIRLAMLFDNSSSVTIAREFEKKAAVRFFRQILRPEKDLAALFSVGTATRLEQTFTGDVGMLTSAIESFPPPIGATALLDGSILAANYLAGMPGRRVIVIVSDGDDTSSDASLEAVLLSLQQNNCQVYVVKTTDFENYVRTRSRTGNANIRQLAAERRMAELAAQTGGAVYSPIDEKELDEAFARIRAELARQYILSYYPEPETEKRGEFRQIGLSVTGRDGVVVRTRKGYYVPKN